jgi:hypothetical protein
LYNIKIGLKSVLLQLYHLLLFCVTMK